MRRCDSGRHAGNDFVGHSGFFESIAFFSETPKNSGIAAFQPYDAETSARGGDHQAIDFGLSDVFRAAALSDIDDQRVRSGERENRRGDEIVGGELRHQSESVRVL